MIHNITFPGQGGGLIVAVLCERHYQVLDSSGGFLSASSARVAPLSIDSEQLCGQEK